MREDYMQLDNEVVFPMNITQFWDYYLELDAPYSWDKALIELGEVFHSKGAWVEPESKDFRGEPVLKERTTTSTSPLPQNQLGITKINFKKVSYLLERNETSVVYLDYYYNSGFTMADRIATMVLYELYQPSADSQKCVWRASWSYEWNEKPWIGVNIMVNLVTEKVEETANYVVEEHFPRSLRFIAADFVP